VGRLVATIHGRRGLLTNRFRRSRGLRRSTTRAGNR
jgi:hypothetical protein